MWESVDSSKATEKQIKYAETLLEAYYGDINFPIYTMSKQDISALIEETKKKLNEKGINYHSSTTEQATGLEVEDRRRYTNNPVSSNDTITLETLRRTSETLSSRRNDAMASMCSAIPTGRRPTTAICDEYDFTTRVSGSTIPEPIGNASVITALQRATSEAMRRTLYEPYAMPTPLRTVREDEIDGLIAQVEREGRFEIIYNPADFSNTIRLDYRSHRRAAFCNLYNGEQTPDAIQRIKKELIQAMAEEVYEDRRRAELERTLEMPVRRPIYGIGEVETIRGDLSVNATTDNTR